MKIEFDVFKNERNIHQRSLQFERVADFDFNTAIVQQDIRLHVLCFTPIDGGIRVISFRKANPREIRSYEQAPPTH
ncbi:BrnT family toxin [Polaromonas sp.]|jgi:uncharacterized DUF497 family protein|uniref:BrnT family toxin n=1 Tax=Polaromonas sp. TaxID=1869339 RepID=UPI001DC3F6B1|nr:BrnT family toxin [Polaromonas sp.]MBT9476496.1 BrnT family toxin [Polaromonas sp.]